MIMLDDSLSSEDKERYASAIDSANDLYEKENALAELKKEAATQFAATGDSINSLGRRDAASKYQIKWTPDSEGNINVDTATARMQANIEAITPTLDAFKK
jgi:hypothetical protein